MSAASRSVQAAPRMRLPGAALVAVVLAIALVALLAFSQLTAAKPQTAPAAGTAPVLHDHGWSTAPAAGTAPALHDHGWSTAPNQSSIDAGRHRPKTTKVGAPAPGIRVGGSNGGAILYVGIPYAAPGQTVGGANGTRFAQ